MTRRDEPEDVLSSIRRLVAGEEEATQPRQPILLLGPAVRVNEFEDAFQMIHRRANERRSVQAQDIEGVAAADVGRDGIVEYGRAGGDAALRALVAEIVREELAGELGQRITRNLRQLVLRELRASNVAGGTIGTETGSDA